jgi:hypothetical protein
MKLKKVVTNDIKQCHPNQKSYQTDQYYQRLANRLQDGFCSLGRIGESRTAEVMHRAAIMLTNYMEDIVADSGQWRSFSNLCQELYGHPVPLFHEDEEYYADEPSLNAIRFLLWSIASDVSGEFVFSDSKPMEMMAIAAHEILEEAFEEAPVNEQLADDVKAELQLATEGFDQLRSVLMQLFSNCYLTTGERNAELLGKHVEEAISMTELEDFPDMSPDMAIFYATTRTIFSYRIGPLALYPKDYLAAMMRTKGMEHQADEVAQIEMLDTGTYKYDSIKPAFGLLGHKPNQNRLRLTRTNGKQFEIEAKELNLPEEELKNFDGFMATSFVYYQGEWHLNGLLFPFSETAKKWKELCEDEPDNLKPGTETLTADMMLERTNGQQIAYFADREKMKDFLEEKIRFPRHMLSFVDERGGDLPTIFIDKEEPKNCLQFFFGASPCIADPSNPFYDKEIAREKAIDILWDAENVTTHAVNYLLEHDFLPDIYNSDVLSKFSTTEEKRHDIDFLMRFYRRENY